MMKEAFLHFIWMHALFNNPLKTSDGQVVQVIHPGFLNYDGGPDFSDARLLCDKIQLAGPIEMHLKSSDWYHHRHHQDPAYDHVLFHVVYDEDRDVFNSQGHKLTQIVLKNQMPAEVLQRYMNLECARTEVPCMNLISGISSMTKEWITARMIAERLEQRGHIFRKLCQQYVNDYRSVLYTLTFRAFGGSINAEPMEMLAGKIPPVFIQRIAPDLFHLEALLFGQGGFLKGESVDDYYKELHHIYSFYHHKFGLKPMEASLWKFHRTRPSNFPTRRIAQLAAWLSQPNHLTPEYIIKMEPDGFLAQHSLKSTSSYWRIHYDFGTTAPERFSGTIGKEMYRNILINAWIPFLFHFGKQCGKPELTEKAIDWLYHLKPEKNHVTKTFEKLTGKLNSAAESQAFLHLYKHYCSDKKCADCQIGKCILKGKSP